jgi:hypothetical protein
MILLAFLVLLARLLFVALWLEANKVKREKHQDVRRHHHLRGDVLGEVFCGERGILVTHPRRDDPQHRHRDQLQNLPLRDERGPTLGESCGVGVVKIHDGVNAAVEQCARFYSNRQIADEEEQPEGCAVVKAVQHCLVGPLPRTALKCAGKHATRTCATVYVQEAVVRRG